MLQDLQAHHEGAWQSTCQELQWKTQQVSPLLLGQDASWLALQAFSQLEAFDWEHSSGEVSSWKVIIDWPC